MFGAFWRKSDPTRGWREDPRIPLLADLERFELSGVGMGAEVERLSFLGPSGSDLLCYPRKGLMVDSENGRLEGFVLALRRGAYLGAVDPADVRPFGGRIRIGGKDLAPPDLRGAADFLAAWGDPFWRDEDDDEVLLFFEFSGHEIQVELGLDGVPQIVLACSPPLMADPDQRRSYGVSKPWPPSFIERTP